MTSILPRSCDHFGFNWGGTAASYKSPFKFCQ
jgi:hypothetical protein